MKRVTARRMGGFVVGGVVIAALVGASAVVVGAGNRLRAFHGHLCPRPPLQGRGRAITPIGGDALSAVADGEPLWVRRGSDAGDSLVALDTRSRAIVGNPVPLPNGATGFAFFDGDLWVTVTPDNLPNRPIPAGSVLRIDASTGRVLSAMGVGRNPYGVAGGFGFVWVVNSADGTVSKIDPSSDRVVAIIAAGASAYRALVGAGSVWVDTEGEGAGSIRIDPRTDRVVARVPGFHVQSIDGNGVWGSGPFMPNGGVMRLDPLTNTTTKAAFPTDIAPATVVAREGRVWVGKWFFYCSQHYPVPEGPAILAFELFELDPATMKPLTKPFAIAFNPVTPVLSDGALWVADPSVGGVLRIDIATAFGN